MFKTILSAALAAPTIALATPPQQVAPETVKAIEAVAYDYVDGQLEGDPARVARALHPDLAKRMVKTADRDETLPLRRMTKDELVSLTADGALKTPKDQWDRQVRVVEVDANIAMARVETPWFIDYFHLGRFGDRWVIVNALWHMKPRQAAPAN
ncbi:nuclear transport factor 2 family protein [Caulobacter segnis]|uniref:nuclear transport factor 2 family protein n=1 Tax=Caulobacter segnis TaxID=88688 RepID=UPI00240FC130|nr:nuclear transport factor 2 family protein [Caulobacter segnis]MDG2522321.1 nuclear transport factor 2 family protein [Caulobacter segnis]